MFLHLLFVIVVVLVAVRGEVDNVVGDGSFQGLIYSSQEMGIYNTTSCSSAPSCGTTMATFNGIAAKSNGANQCTGSSCGGYGTYGYHYQCVELAQRYFGEKHGTTAIWHVNAKDMCSTHPSGVSKTSSPQPGDLFVRTSGTYGHVAVITAVHSSTVDVIEQNSSPSGRNTYYKSDAGCFLTAGSSPSPSGSCPNKGYYCGNDKGLGKDANNLYYCSAAGATPSLSKDCGFTCTIMPSGQDDKCGSGSCANVNTGYYCGSDKIGGDKNTLYLCKSSKPSGSKYCANGCVTASSGNDDYCA